MIFPVQGPKKWFAKCDKHYPSRSGQTSLATAVTKPVTKNNFGPSTFPRRLAWEIATKGRPRITLPQAHIVR